MIQELDYRTALDYGGLVQSALFSKDGKYRYALQRDWKKTGNMLVYILLNPSTGDEKSLETTTKGCMTRAQNWGYTGMIVLNLFAYISTNPHNLTTVNDPVGEYNNHVIKHIVDQVTDGSHIIAAWGNHGKLYNRDKEVLKLLSHKDVFCLGVNKDGSPRHPLHMSHSIKPELWRNARQ